VQQSPQVQCTLQIEAQVSDTFYKVRGILTLGSDKRVRPKISRTRHRIDHRDLEAESERYKGYHMADARRVPRLALTGEWWRVVPLDVPTVWPGRNLTT
jgi:hypothetical protein